MPRHAVATPIDGEMTPLDTISIEQARELAADIDVPGIDPQQVHRKVNAAADLYRWQLHVADARRPKPARDSLDRVQTLLGKTVAALDALDRLPRRELDDVLVQTLGRLGAANEGIGATRDRMTVLMDAAKRARDSLPDGKGRPNIDQLRQLCGHLATEYEGFGGKPFTYDVHRNNGRIDFMTDGAKWVAKAARMVDPEVTAKNLDVAMRYLQKTPL